jgi:hypothetical protein
VNTREIAGQILREERELYRVKLIIPGIIDHPQLSPNDHWAIALNAIERVLDIAPSGAVRALTQSQEAPVTAQEAAGDA